METSHPRYPELARRLAVARRAYKRANAAAGAVVFLIEALGTIAIVVAADVLFDLAMPGRIALFAIAAVALLCFAWRNIVRPLLRPISDQRIALYLEQRTPRFEGALIAAAEFGPQSYTGRTAQIIDSILDQAVLRAGQFDLRKAIDLSRLRKYGAIAAILLTVYLIAAFTMPGTVSRRFTRVLTPWKSPPAQAPPLAATPLELSVDPGDTALVRGGTLALHALASRRPHESVNFHFRSLAGAGEWKMLPMAEIDQLNTFGLTLPDINEDLEYFVSSENVKSRPHRISVYDPLLIKSYEIVTRHPEYLKLADTVVSATSPDITAPQGSRITLRIAANGPLESARIAWEGENPADSPTAIDPTDDTLAVATFDVQSNAAFNVHLSDVHGQSASTLIPAAVTAVIDAPPAIRLIAPDATVTTNPLGEIAFTATVTDDLALDSVELVISNDLDPAAAVIRHPVRLDPSPVDGVGLTGARANIVLMLEEMELSPGDILSCHLEVSDRKGQRAPSDLVRIIVTSYESWAVFSLAESIGGERVSHQLEPVLKAAWRLHATAGQMTPNDLHRQAEELAATMVDSTGALLLYYNPLEATPEQRAHGERAMQFAQAGHDSLKAHQVEKAVQELRIAVAELIAAGWIDTLVMTPPPPDGGTASGDLLETVTQLTALIEESDSAAAAGSRSELDAAAQAASLLAEVEAIERSHAVLLDKLNKAVESKDDSAPTTAEPQTALADKTASIARDIKASAGADAEKQSAAEALATAAATMRAAADQSVAGNATAAARDAENAQRRIADARSRLQGASQDNLNTALDKAESAANTLARKQGELVNRTEQADKADDQAKKNEVAAIGADQVKLTNDLNELARTLDGLAKAGADGALRLDTNKHIQTAKTQLARGRVEQKIANVAIQLAAGDTTGAVSEQKRIQDVLDKVARSLTNAGATRAGDPATALKRARDDAANVSTNLDKLRDAAQNSPADASPEARKQLARNTADDLARLSRQLHARDFSGGEDAFKKDAQALTGASQNTPRLSDELENAPARIDELAAVTQRVRDHLESEYESMLRSRELFAAQREECPPEYRPLVNQYFEALSTGAP